MSVIFLDIVNHGVKFFRDIMMRKVSLFFPLLNQKLDLSGEQEQHRGIHAFISGFLEYITSTRSNPMQFSAEKLKNMMKEVHESLVSNTYMHKIKIPGKRRSDFLRKLFFLFFSSSVSKDATP